MTRTPVADPTAGVSPDGSFRRATLFSSSRWAWGAVIVYTLVLYASLTLTYTLYLAVFNRIGEQNMVRLLGAVFVVAALGVVALVWFRGPGTISSWISLFVIGGVLAYSLSRVEVPANQIHFLQYGPLALLVFDALRFQRRDRYLYLWTFLICLMIGIGDELLQSLLPDRRFDPHDVVLNAEAVALTLAFIGFVTTEEHYPWSGRREASTIDRDGP